MIIFTFKLPAAFEIVSVNFRSVIYYDEAKSQKVRKYGAAHIHTHRQGYALL